MGEKYVFSYFFSLFLVVSIICYYFCNKQKTKKKNYVSFNRNCNKAFAITV